MSVSLSFSGFHMGIPFLYLKINKMHFQQPLCDLSSHQSESFTAVFVSLRHRVYTSPPIFASCRDCQSYLALAKTVHDLLLPAETGVVGK